MELPSFVLEAIIDNALKEDIAWGDLTTEALITPHLQGRGCIVVKEAGVVAGIDVAMTVFTTVDSSLHTDVFISDGTHVDPGTAIASIEGKVASILKAERVALNFLQRMSGIATATARYVEAVAGTGARIIDTRKTPPGLRLLDKYAVRVGGGSNHRFNLADGILIKDNHLAALRAQGLGLRDAVRMARQRAPHTIKVEVEVETVEEAQEAAEAGADIVLLDNMSPELMRQAVAAVAGRAPTEASGGIRLETVRAVAEAGVTLISSGALTHSVKALDVSLEMDLA